MNEYGETPRVYIWPKNHEPGAAYPEDFWRRFSDVMDEFDFEWEA